MISWNRFVGVNGEGRWNWSQHYKVLSHKSSIRRVKVVNKIGWKLIGFGCRFEWMYAYNANPSMYTYLFGRTWPVFLVSSVVVISVTVIVCIVFNSFYAINSSDKLEIAHLRFAQFRKLLHIAIFFFSSSPLCLSYMMMATERYS